jgi:Bacterial SH3 domain
MKTLALFPAAVLVILGLAQPDPKRTGLRPVLPSPQTSNTIVVPAPPVPSLDTSKPAPLAPVPVTQKLPHPLTPKAVAPTPQPSPQKMEAWVEDVEKTLRNIPPPPAVPPEQQASAEPPTTIVLEEKPEIGVPLEPRVPKQASITAPDHFVVKTQRLNVRIDASAKAQKIGELLQGEEVTAVFSLYGNEVNGWIEITARNGLLNGWVKKSLLRAKTARP